MSLIPLHERALDLELTGLSVIQIAKQLKRSVRTLHYWRQTPEYKAARKKLAARTREDSLARLNTLTDKAIHKLEELLEAVKVSASGEESPAVSTQLAAVKEILARTVNNSAEGEQVVGQITLQLPPSGFRK